MQLVIAEKPSVAQSIAAALGVKEKKDGYIEGGGYLIMVCRAFGTACGSCRLWGTVPKMEL